MNVFCTMREWHTAQFRVVAEAIEDNDADMSWDDDGTAQAALDRGELQLFGVRVRVIHDTLGTIGSDSLWSCIYESPAAFMNHKECAAATRKLRAEGSNAICGSYFSDLIAGAIAEARDALRTAKGIHVRSNS
jgi:hypothetical protein